MARVAPHARRTIVQDTYDYNDTDYPAASAASTRIAADIVWFFAGLLLSILAIRFVLSLLGANTTNVFANFIYNLSHPFVAPFFNLFHYNNIQYGIGRFEVYTLVAMLVYGLIAWLITYLLTLGDHEV